MLSSVSVLVIVSLQNNRKVTKTNTVFIRTEIMMENKYLRYYILKDKLFYRVREFLNIKNEKVKK